MNSNPPASVSALLGSKSFATKASFRFGFGKEESPLYSRKVARINQQKLNLRKAAHIYYTQKRKTSDYHSFNNIRPKPHPEDSVVTLNFPPPRRRFTTVVEVEHSPDFPSKPGKGAAVRALQTLPYKGNVVFSLLLINKD